MSFEYRKRVRFGEVDFAGIAYYPRLFHFCHLAMEDFFEVEGGFPYDRLVRDRRVGFPAVHLEADFRAPLAFGDDLHVTVEIVSVGRASVVTRYRFRRPDGEDCAEVSITTACVAMDHFASQAIPDDVRTFLERHLERS